MNPKIIIIGEETQQRTKKPMQFIKGLMLDGTIEPSDPHRPKAFKYIELIARNYGQKDGKFFDLIFCYNSPDKRNDGVLFWGYWNDGVVE